MGWIEKIFGSNDKLPKRISFPPPPPPPPDVKKSYIISQIKIDDRWAFAVGCGNVVEIVKEDNSEYKVVFKNGRSLVNLKLLNRRSYSGNQ